MGAALQIRSPWVEALGRLLTDEFELFAAILVVLLGVVLAVAVARVVRRVLNAFGIPETVEGTPFERTARRLGTSSVSLLALVAGLFVFVIALLVALRILGVLTRELFATQLAVYLPQVFAAAVVLIVGLIAGDMAGLAVSERLRSVKLPEVGVVPTLVKYSIFYVAALIALSQLGVATAALLVLLAAYAFGVFFLGGLAFRDLLASAAAGVYLLLTEPYAIGDTVEIDGRRGIVQEVDVFVTRIESDGEEYVVPNRQVFRNGIVRVRN